MDSPSSLDIQSTSQGSSTMATQHHPRAPSPLGLGLGSAPGVSDAPRPRLPSLRDLLCATTPTADGRLDSDGSASFFVWDSAPLPKPSHHPSPDLARLGGPVARLPSLAPLLASTTVQNPPPSWAQHPADFFLACKDHLPPTPSPSSPSNSSASVATSSPPSYAPSLDLSSTKASSYGGDYVQQSSTSSLYYTIRSDSPVPPSLKRVASYSSPRSLYPPSPAASIRGTTTQHFVHPAHSRSPSPYSSPYPSYRYATSSVDYRSSWGSTSATKATLLQRMPFVAPEKQFECPECQRKFARRNDLIRHGRIHSGESPFKCERCGLGFKRSDARRRHERKGEC